MVSWICFVWIVKLKGKWKMNCFCVVLFLVILIFMGFLALQKCVNEIHAKVNCHTVLHWSWLKFHCDCALKTCEMRMHAKWGPTWDKCEAELLDFATLPLLPCKHHHPHRSLRNLWKSISTRPFVKMSAFWTELSIFSNRISEFGFPMCCLV